MTIHIALAVHDVSGGYSQHAGVALCSLLSLASQPVCVHILHDATLTEENRRSLQQVAETVDARILFYLLQLPADWTTVSTGAYTPGILFRLLAPTLLPVDRLLYFDCDIVCRLDIAELWREPLGGCPIAAVPDRGVTALDADHQERLCRAGLDLQRYFNSGVLVLDLAWLRRELDLKEKFAQFLAHFPESMMLDQDFLNWLFGDHYCQLPEKYNTLVKCCHEAGEKDACDLNEPRIWHFSGLKPWDRYESKLDRWYWLTLAQTPWQGQAVPGLLAAVDAKLDQLLYSRSWRMTAPYRTLGDWLRGKWGLFR
jgi:lipopolysaccharide biosynthesis glycosyltransferase